MSNVEMIGFANAVAGLTPAAAWAAVNHHPRPHDASLPAQAKREQQIEWAVEQFRRTGIHDHCFITLSCVGELPWFEFALPEGVEGLAVYWSGLLIRSALIFDADEVLLLHAGERGFSARYYPRDLFPDA